MHKDLPDITTHSTTMSPVQELAYQHSFYPRTIRDWNELPHYIIETNIFNYSCYCNHTFDATPSWAYQFSACPVLK